MMCVWVWWGAVLGNKPYWSQASALELFPEEFNKPQPVMVNKAKYLVFICVHLVSTKVGVQPLNPV